MSSIFRMPTVIALLGILFSQLVFSHGMSEEEKQAIIEGGNLSYLWLGATHMLSGYDHLAFVFGIVFFLKSFRNIAKYVTAFTLGHSVTLIFATYQGIQINYYLIDAVIALSVTYIAFTNLGGFQKYLKIEAPNMLAMITGLGLIHGFGLSTRLQELPLDAENLLLNIITFNLGIELGQLAALAVMLMILHMWRERESFRPFSRLANSGLMALGLLLFLMQLHDYSHANDAAATTTVSLPAEAESGEWQDSVVIELPPQGYKEYKVMQAKGKLLAYEWNAEGGALYYDFHGEPAGDKTGFFQSYKIGTDSSASGAVTTPFAGTHGWYWKNKSDNPVKITLNFRGDYILMQ